MTEKALDWHHVAARTEVAPPDAFVAGDVGNNT